MSTLTQKLTSDLKQCPRYSRLRNPAVLLVENVLDNKTRTKFLQGMRFLQNKKEHTASFKAEKHQWTRFLVKTKIFYLSVLEGFFPKMRFFLKNLTPCAISEKQWS